MLVVVVGEKPVGDVAEEGELLEVAECGEEYVASVGLYLAHLAELVAESVAAEHVVPLGVAVGGECPQVEVAAVDLVAQVVL